MSMSPMPWHTAALRTLMQTTRGHHATLLVGAPGIGTISLAQAFAAATLCRTPDQHAACGTCESCLWWKGGLHPDLKVVRPDENDEDEPDEAAELKEKKQKRREIKIDAIRALTEWAPATAHGTNKMVVIQEANSLNVESANALLKLLEEPPPSVSFILTTQDRKRLPATVISRCVSVVVSVPSEKDAKAWLESEGIAPGEAASLLAQAGGFPLDAKALADDGVQALRRAFLSALCEPQSLSALSWGDSIAKVGKGDRRDVLGHYLDWLIRWMHDVAAVRAEGVPRYNPDFARELEKVSKTLHAIAGFRYYAKLIGQKRLIQHPLDARLVLENVLIGYKQLLR